MIKAGVNASGLKPEILLAIVLVQPVFLQHGRPLVITAITDGKHRHDSLHYAGQAVDLRSKHIGSLAEKLEIFEEIKKVLGSQYDVLLEAIDTPNEHYHIEFDPR